MPVSVPVGGGAREHVEVRRGEYHDSVTLMLAGRAVAEVPGVDRVLVAMATELNIALLAELGYPPPSGELGPADLIIAFTCAPDASAAEASAALAAALTPKASTTSAAQPGGSITAPGHASPDHPLTPLPRTTGTALGRTSAPITLISTPGLASVTEAMESLEYGASPIIFSDNIPLHHEVRLKEEARRRGLLVMGPDCGTVVLHGTGLGFANVTRPGPLSLAAASGTGAQQLMALLDAANTGIHHCLGVGGRDLTEHVAGRSTLAALTALTADPHTELIAVVSKPPHPATAARIEAHAATLTKPVHFAFVGPDHPTLTESAERILQAMGHPAPTTWPRWTPDDSADKETAYPEHPARPEHSRAPAIRGLFSGGTLCAEAEVVLRRACALAQAEADPAAAAAVDPAADPAAHGQTLNNEKSGGWGQGKSRRLSASTADPAAAPASAAAADRRPGATASLNHAATPEPTPATTGSAAPASAAAADRRPGATASLNHPATPQAAPATSDLTDTATDSATDPAATPTTPPFTFDLTDFGDDAYTRGRPHPMIDNTLRLRALADVAGDAGVGVVLLDVVLGRGAHPDPGAEVAEAVAGLLRRRAEVAVVVSLCGTVGDPQGLGRQGEMLAAAGAWVFLSNAEAAAAAARLAVGEPAVRGVRR